MCYGSILRMGFIRGPFCDRIDSVALSMNIGILCDPLIHGSGPFATACSLDHNKTRSAVLHYQLLANGQERPWSLIPLHFARWSRARTKGRRTPPN